MRVPLSWLHHFVDPGLSAEQLASTLTLGGLVVEAIHHPTAGTRGVVVARVEAIEPVPASSKLWLVDVYDGGEHHEIVCGASNFAVGDLVPAALPGATLPGGVRIERRTIRNVVSNGMLASARELRVGDDHRGIWVLDADAPLGADLGEWLELDDVVLELEINPDRGYALSIFGVAHDVAALTGAELRLPEPGSLPIGTATGVGVSIADPDRCQRFSLTRIEGVSVGPSPAWLQRRLAAAGMRPISNVVDATNHAMLETGHPVHAYDLARLAGPRIDVRQAASGDTVVTLDGVRRELDPGDLVIADASGPVGLAGVMGGASTEVDETTTDVLLEVAAFSPAAVLRTARRLKLFTEASTRFEKTVPPQTVLRGAARCAALLTQVAGGRISAAADVWPQPASREVIGLRTDRVRRHLGMDLPDQRQAELLESIECSVSEAQDTAVLAVTPPDYRPDLRIEVDLDEEIARLHGYEQIPERVPCSGRAGGRRPAHAARRRVREALAGAGWTEAITFPFIGPDDLDALGLPPDDSRHQTVALVNPLSQEESRLRTSLLPGLLRALRRNVNRQAADVAMFEVGAVFLPPTPQEPGADGGTDGITLPAEPLLLGLAACGDFEGPRYDRPARPADLADLLGAADTARRAVGLPPLEVAAGTEPGYHPGRTARLSLDGTAIGVVGELHPRTIAALQLPARTLAGELRLDRLTAEGVHLAAAAVPDTRPPLRFDVAVLVAADVPAGAVEAAVREGAGPSLIQCRLFDVFTGPQLGEGRKSLAYALRLEAGDGALTDVDEQAAITSIEQAVARRVDGRLRREDSVGVAVQDQRR
ncbi:MAG: phenylalanine--tRNA ligase subunit beta [Actinomycetota bacterium]|nr:phenylalanine--tRNA ligase subunit beta [Actinomycetota bacterium]